ncbi:Protein smf [Saliniradius amylolyticus]|uniref:Protein smf n=1 Tax=Saliniradius amylolyticus TaxID=2183582 RepID=A0A2S2DYR2_9ALTE|nr:DNA-processing protein DprA [Saliniradius amylolyticus]AWL10538.1 Protein smf [Saliniradius amylolyticus]
MSKELTLEHWLILDQMPGLSSSLFQRLIEGLGPDLARLARLHKGNLSQWGLSKEQVNILLQPNQLWLRQGLEWLDSEPSHFILTFCDEAYPEHLRELARPPLLLFGIGDPSVISRPQIAMVGSRNPDTYGREQAYALSRGLAEKGMVVTSGLALGIDGWSHKGALAGKGKTIGVLGCGIDQVYPRRHKELASKIIEQGGCILSEFAPGVPTLAKNFPRRNRIISGLSLGTVVIEAAIKSGSLITARYAIEQGKDVFALPGHIHNPMAQGCHFLIKQGAKLIESADEILEEYPHVRLETSFEAIPNEQKSEAESLARDPLLDSVDYEVTPIDVVAQRSNRPVTAVLSQLVEYELRGLVAAVPGGYIKLRGR